MSNLESDSDSDSDYAPDINDNEDDANEVEETVTVIPLSRKRKADSTFDDMVALENQEVEAKMQKTVSHQTKGSKQSKAKRKKKQDLQDVMSTIFGSNSNTFKKFSSSSRGVKSKVKGVSSSADGNTDIDILKAAKELVKKTQKKIVITETKKFAGQAISVERTINPGTSQTLSGSGAQASSTNKDSSLDKVLQDIKGPQAISTVLKSSMDWDTYKDKEGLEEDLAGATKEGYLTRKDFLERCDVRAFEKERDQRLSTSSKK